MLLANYKIEYQMFNDQIAVMFIAFAIYLFCINENAIYASVFLGFAWSIKAPTSLILPSFLGAIQYNFGTITLLKSIFVIFFIQYLVAAPFIHSFLGGKTDLQKYLYFAKYTGGDQSETLTQHQFSIYWTFLSKEQFNSKTFIMLTKFSIVGLNIYHFFLRKGATL